MAGCGRHPDELESLLEDALIAGDIRALAGLFEARAVVVTPAGAELRGRDRIVRGLDEPPPSGPHHQVTQAGRAALVIGTASIGVALRDGGRCWRYAIRVGLVTASCDGARVHTSKIRRR